MFMAGLSVISLNWNLSVFLFLQPHMNLVGIFSHSYCQDQFLPFYLSLRVYNLFSIFTNFHFDVVSEVGRDKHI